MPGGGKRGDWNGGLREFSGVMGIWMVVTQVNTIVKTHTHQSRCVHVLTRKL